MSPLLSQCGVMAAHRTHAPKVLFESSICDFGGKKNDL